jgi:hypothetical protein
MYVFIYHIGYYLEKYQKKKKKKTQIDGKDTA